MPLLIRSQTEPGSALAPGSAVMARKNAHAANRPQLTRSAATVPPAATTIPPITGPAMNAAENPNPPRALPSWSRSTDLRISVRVAVASDRAVAAITPSASASSRTGTSEK